MPSDSRDPAPPERGLMEAWGGWGVLVGLAGLMILMNAVLFLQLGQGGIFWTLKSPFTVASIAFIAVNVVFCAAVASRFCLGVSGLSPRTALLLLCAISGALTLAVGAWALQSFPNSADEYAYLFETWTFDAGRLWNAPPPLGQPMASLYTWVTPTKWASSYQPGWPLVMAPVVAAGLPGWTVNILLLPAAVLMLYDLVARRAGVAAALAAAALFALSPFTIFNAASFFPHLFSATSALLAFWSTDRLLAEPRARWGVVLGVAIGLLGLTRLLDAVIVLAPLSTVLARQRWFWTGSVWWIALGGAPFLLGLLGYQWALTGDPLKPTYYFGGRTLDHLYFDAGSILQGLSLVIKRACELALWASPPAAMLWGAALGLKAWKGRLEPLDALLPVAILIFVFYPFDAGNRYGPRYYFDSWPALPFTIATALPLVSERLRSVAQSLIVLAVIYSVGVLGFLARDYRTLINERRDIYDGADRLASGPAVVCFRSASGLHLPMQPVDLARNGTAPIGRILYVSCEPGMPEAIRKAYPARTLWFYDRRDEELHGRFLPDLLPR